MTKQAMFAEETLVLERAGAVADDPDFQGSPFHVEFQSLLGEYQRLFKQVQRLIRLSDKQQHGLITELEQAFESFIRTLVTTIDAKHQNTAGHSTRVTEYVLFLGEKLALSREEMEVLKYAGLLHDIGKIGIPDIVLTKRGRFTDEERAIMNEHAVWTRRIVSGIHLPRHLRELPKMTACHHEKLDGTGYPYGLIGDDIPFFSRILAVGDVFDALTSRRDYPKYDKEKDLGFDPMSMDRAFGILEKDQGAHFDPAVVTVALRYRAEMENLWRDLHKKPHPKASPGQ